MSSKPFFPSIPATIAPAIRATMFHMSKEPAYLDHPECPYPDDLKLLLSACARGDIQDHDGIGPITVDPTVENLFATSDKYEIMQQQTELLYSSMLALKSKIDISNKTDKTVAFYKILVSTLERLISVGERVAEVKSINDFKRRVMSAMETLLTPEQRQELIKILGSQEG